MNFHFHLAFLLISIINISRAVIFKNVETHTPKNIVPSDGKEIETLDDEGNVILSWIVHEAEEEVEFELEVKTTGYVGFGISPTGGMLGADIFIAGVFDNGDTYHHDMHGVGFEKPVQDDNQNWNLLDAKEDGGITYLKFSRKINTCDDQDYPIGMDTSRLIWARGNGDTVEYHTPSRRGTKSVTLLGAKMPALDVDVTPYWDMVLQNVMPSADTSYWCSFHRGPKLSAKHHIIGFEPVLSDKLSVTHTHHFLLYNCYEPSTGSLEAALGNLTVDKDHRGNHCHITTQRYHCDEYLSVWAKGGKRTAFPPNVGYPVGENDSATEGRFYMLEIHYDNPSETENLEFESGIRVYYTDQLREIDAGLLTLGHDVHPSMTISPNTAEFVVVGHCASTCTQRAFQSQVDGVKAFNSLLHSHISGRKLKLRHFRGEKELPYLDFDDHYDFDYQQNKHLNKEVTILPGDHITYECTYDSRWKKGQVVVGGEPTTYEMCVAFLWYYPKKAMDTCISSYNTRNAMTEFGITNYTLGGSGQNISIRINEPPQLEGDYEASMSYKFNWTDEFIKEIESKRRYGVHGSICFSRAGTFTPSFGQVRYPNITESFVPEDVCEPILTTTEKEVTTPETIRTTEKEVTSPETIRTIEKEVTTPGTIRTTEKELTSPETIRTTEKEVSSPETIRTTEKEVTTLETIRTTEKEVTTPIRTTENEVTTPIRTTEKEVTTPETIRTTENKVTTPIRTTRK